MDFDLIDRARAWINGDPDPRTRITLSAMVDEGDDEALRTHVDGRLEFGTAGLRGVVGPGPLRMNRAVVIRTTKGLADYLTAHVDGARQAGVVVGFDARHDSERFGHDTAGVLAAAGINVYFFDTPQPTPLVAYAQRILGAAAAVVITASHNPPEYNGYKVYGDGAAQIVPPADAAISIAIDAAGPANEIPIAAMTDERIHVLGGDIADRYLADIADARPSVEGPDVRIVYTPLHGVGGQLVARALADGGYNDVHIVPSQAEPDGDFPTVAFPNPEEPGSMDEAIALAVDVHADVILANDPDADRLAAGVPAGEAYRLLSGNQIGILLADHLLRQSDVDSPLVVASIVSTPMLSSVARHHGAHAEYTLTGFKWICAAARTLEQESGLRFIFGFEEALGSSVGTVVRDKDGISAAVAFADLVRDLKATGLTVDDRLRELAEQHGLWVSRQLSINLPGADGKRKIDAAMARLAAEFPDVLAGHQVVSAVDYRQGAQDRPAWLTTHDLVALELADGRAMIRPSGTEPKCKIYVDLRGNISHDAGMGEETAALEAEAGQIAAALAKFVGLDDNR